VSFTSDLLVGVAQRLHTAGIGVYDADGGYSDSDVAIVFRAFGQAPDRQIALTTYGVDDNFALSDSVVGLQVRTRGTKDPTVVDAIDDAIFNNLHGAWSATLGSVQVVSVARTSATPFGADGNGRWERVSNYYLTTHRPSPNRT
jgi:hypothetical protein